MSFVTEKKQPFAGPIGDETQRGEVEREAGERGARRAGYVLAAVGMLLMLLSSAGGSLAEGVRGLEEVLRDDTRLGYLLDDAGYVSAGADEEQDLLSPDQETLPSGHGGEMPGSEGTR